jgi:hypothetical protein
MLKIISVISLCLSGSFCAAQEKDSAVVHTIFLIGDAGEPHVKDGSLGRVLSGHIHDAGARSTVLFLGDNIYPAGLPESDAPDRAEAERILKTQIEFVRGTGTQTIFIPGNHDWHHWGRKGLEYVRNQQQWIDSLKDVNTTLLPRDGCPGPIEIPIGEQSVLVILDTQWFLHQWEKTTDEELCNATTPAGVLAMVEDIFRRNRGKRIIVAAHHPLITYGEHGGVFTWKAHIFPLEEISKGLYIPLPVVGSIYPLYRKLLGHLQDTRHPLYRNFGEPLQRIMRDYPGAVYVAGHEHALQYIVKDRTHFVVSGSAAKTEYVRQKEHAVYARDVRGFARLSILATGELDLVFYQVDDSHPDGTVVFTKRIDAVPGDHTEIPAVPDYRGQYVTVKASEQYAAGKLKERMLGKNYRAAWSQKVQVPVFDLGHEKGGLRILQKGGGQQTLSLRLADSSGREYVLRSVEKYPEAAIPEMLRETFAQDLVQDQISASHPYAALVVAPMASAVGLYHTKPRLVFIPDDPRLGVYREMFANTLALFEERPDEDWSHADHFGNSKNIVSTRKVIEKLADDNDNSIDERFVLKNRLFDLIIGDWDRHEDQWRWAEMSVDKDEVYKPIPRDRDQAFFVNEGTLAKLWSRKWALPKFEGFDDEIRWPSGLSFNARHFDRTFLTGLSRQDWIAVAEELKNALTDEVITASIREWPPEIFDLHGEEVIRKLKQRRDEIVSYAISHYEFLARKVDVNGSDKMESFEVERLPDGDVHVRVFKITKKGVRGKELYNRLFRKSETAELRLYGLDGEDVFEISGSSDTSIPIRVIGGNGKDLLLDRSEVKSLLKKTLFYDQVGQGDFRSAGEVRDLRSLDPSVNEYDREAFAYDRLAPLLYGNYNPDDGIFLGAGFFFLTHGFRKDPFSQRHLFLASIAPSTRSYNFTYQGKFTEVFGQWNVELDADLKVPNFVNNFFGMGNESVFNDDIEDMPGLDIDEDIHYYRYRFEEIWIQPSLSRDFGRWGLLKFGPVFQRVKMEEPEPGDLRYIQEFANSFSPGLFREANTYGGVSWQHEVSRRNDPLYTQRGSVLTIGGKHLGRLDGDGNFSAYRGSLALFHSFREESRLVFASRIGGGINTGAYPFYQAQVLDGKTSLRGFRKTRFYGNSQLFANFELRLQLLTFRSYLFPATMGVLGFYDVGRIWYKNERGLDPTAPGGRSTLWHKGWGGGVWFTPFNLTVLSAELGHSTEGTLGYVRLGFLF